MKRFLLSFLAIFFPGTIFLLEGRLEFAVFAFTMQASIIGWIPISVVAWRHREALGLKPKQSKQSKAEVKADTEEKTSSSENSEDLEHKP
ncbi:MAG: hypothetical protein P1U39_03325 [Legionellaceae bacterium]|jgi:hypothetical protein|nr:hypothetical protein [Legionellaceae bacterium]